MSICIELSGDHGCGSWLSVCNIAYVCSVVVATSVFNAFCDQGPAEGKTIFWRRRRWNAIDAVVFVHGAIVARFIRWDNPVYVCRL